MKNKEEQFKILASYWCGKLNTKFPIFIKQNKRNKFLGAVSNIHKNTFRFNYNLNKIKNIEFSELINFILHEIGHLKDNKTKNYIEKEYLAGKFSLKLLKKYYPKEYKNEVKIWKKTLQNKDWQRMFPEHYKAFKMIKEYNE